MKTYIFYLIFSFLLCLGPQVTPSNAGGGGDIGVLQTNYGQSSKKNYKKPISGSEEAIKWGKKKKGDKSLAKLCLRFVAQCYAQDDNESSGYKSPIKMAEKVKLHDTEEYGWTKAPKGALLFFHDSKGSGLLNEYGHVGIYTGGSKMVHAHWENGPQHDPISVIKAEHYIGWSYPDKDWD